MKLVTEELNELNNRQTRQTNRDVVGVSVIGGGVRIHTRKQSAFDVARGISDEDDVLRARFSHAPLATIRNAAQKAFARHGVNLNGITLDEYAHSVANGTDYRFVVAY